MGLLEFSLTTTTPCEGQGSYYAFGYYQDEENFHVERLSQTSLGRSYDGYKDAEAGVLRANAFVRHLAAVAVAKLCDGPKHGCTEPTLSLVENVVFTLPNELRLPIRPIGAIPVVGNGIHRTTPYSELVERHSPIYEPTVFLPYPVNEALERHAHNVVQALGSHGLSMRHPVYVALRGDEHIIETLPEL